MEASYYIIPCLALCSVNVSYNASSFTTSTILDFLHLMLFARGLCAFRCFCRWWSTYLALHCNVLTVGQQFLSMAHCVASPFCAKLPMLRRPIRGTYFSFQTTNLNTIHRFHASYFFLFIRPSILFASAHFLLLPPPHKIPQRQMSDNTDKAKYIW